MRYLLLLSMLLSLSAFSQPVRDDGDDTDNHAALNASATPTNSLDGLNLKDEGNSDSFLWGGYYGYPYSYGYYPYYYGYGFGYPYLYGSYYPYYGYGYGYGCYFR